MKYHYQSKKSNKTFEVVSCACFLYAGPKLHAPLNDWSKILKVVIHILLTPEDHLVSLFIQSSWKYQG